jgi:hypothetical protein
MTAKRRTWDRCPASLEAAFQDPENCPLDPAAKVALSDDPQTYKWALLLLRNMAEFGRQDAGVFLIGLLMTCGAKWKKRMAVVGMLHAVETDACVDLLIGELRTVRSVNSTRPYLQEVIDALSCLPANLVRRKLQALAEDVALTPWVRTRIQAAMESLWDGPSLGNCR